METVLCKTMADQFGDLLLCFTLFLGQRYRANIDTQGGGSRTLVEGEVMHTHTRCSPYIATINLQRHVLYFQLHFINDLPFKFVASTSTARLFGKGTN